ncbi:MAG: hypothetical protein GY929_10710 [Actinomycetia bacterium]|nr:hypothetical protein [Actinomycetes bacterium]
MTHCTCTSCRTYQKVTSDRVEGVDDSVLGPILWYRCTSCDQITPTGVAYSELTSLRWTLAA